MTRWNLHEIIIYSHDDRQVSINLNLDSVSVVCGASNTGKSSLIDIIDYTLGSSRCRIPEFIRKSSSWVATAWKRGEVGFVAARKIPPRAQKSTDECFFAVGLSDVLPDAGGELESNANRDGLRAQLEQQLGIGSMVTDASSSQSARKIGVRAIVPYLFQSGGVITNPSVLLRGLETNRRQDIIDAFPYLVGAIDEGTVDLVARLRYRRHQEKGLLRAIAEDEAIASNQIERASTLLTEAVELGLVGRSEVADGLTDDFRTLREVSEWTPSEQVIEEDPQLSDLYADERELSDEIGLLRERQRSAEELRQASLLFQDSVHEQHKRLEPIGLLADLKQEHLCPFCGSPEGSESPLRDDLVEALELLETELHSASQDRPKLDEHIRSLESQIQETSHELKRVRSNIRALVQERENVLREIELDGRRHRIVGRISLFLEAVEQSAGRRERESELQATRAEITELEERVGSQARREAIEEARDRINQLTTKHIEQLPFDEHYRESMVALNPRNLEVSLITSARGIPMEDIGSDENYLSLHIAFSLAFQQIFAERNRPVPGLLVLDQLSRPYFSDQTPKDQQRISSADEISLRTFVQRIFAHAAESEGLQVLILEHARLYDDARYRSSVVAEWEAGEGLIPRDWPRSGD